MTLFLLFFEMTIFGTAALNYVRMKQATFSWPENVLLNNQRRNRLSDDICFLECGRNEKDTKTGSKIESQNQDIIENDSYLNEEQVKDILKKQKRMNTICKHAKKEMSSLHDFLDFISCLTLEAEKICVSGILDGDSKETSETSHNFEQDLDGVLSSDESSCRGSLLICVTTLGITRTFLTRRNIISFQNYCLFESIFINNVSVEVPTSESNGDKDDHSLLPFNKLILKAEKFANSQIFLKGKKKKVLEEFLGINLVLESHKNFVIGKLKPRMQLVWVNGPITKDTHTGSFKFHGLRIRGWDENDISGIPFLPNSIRLLTSLLQYFSKMEDYESFSFLLSKHALCLIEWGLAKHESLLLEKGMSLAIVARQVSHGSCLWADAAILRGRYYLDGSITELYHTIIEEQRNMHSSDEKVKILRLLAAEVIVSNLIGSIGGSVNHSFRYIMYTKDILPALEPDFSWETVIRLCMSRIRQLESFS